MLRDRVVRPESVDAKHGRHGRTHRESRGSFCRRRKFKILELRRCRVDPVFGVWDELPVLVLIGLYAVLDFVRGAEIGLGMSDQTRSADLEIWTGLNRNRLGADLAGVAVQRVVLQPMGIVKHFFTPQQLIHKLLQNYEKEPENLYHLENQLYLNGTNLCATNSVTRRADFLFNIWSVATVKTFPKVASKFCQILNRYP